MGWEASFFSQLSGVRPQLVVFGQIQTTTLANAAAAGGIENQ
jgi:hypothetical protein